MGQREVGSTRTVRLQRSAVLEADRQRAMGNGEVWARLSAGWTVRTRSNAASSKRSTRSTSRRLATSSNWAVSALLRHVTSHDIPILGPVLGPPAPSPISHGRLPAIHARADGPTEQPTSRVQWPPSLAHRPCARSVVERETTGTCRYRTDAIGGRTLRLPA
jgi:hypothetical protein